ncbi:hypothetical protein DFJ63DRAFT_317717 [Scheffersomyces coipomensis]|uniref:uncharacterized protein n=1 Tax=Scheffersomyces coipomensis TaxID=1788519 RepID=UPI00315CC4C8
MNQRLRLQHYKISDFFAEESTIEERQRLLPLHNTTIIRHEIQNEERQENETESKTKWITTLEILIIAFLVILSISSIVFHIMYKEVPIGKSIREFSIIVSGVFLVLSFDRLVNGLAEYFEIDLLKENQLSKSDYIIYSLIAVCSIIVLYILFH